MCPEIPSDTMEEVKQEVEMKARTGNSFIFHLDKDHVSEFMNYGKPQYEIARIIGKELALDLWGLKVEDIRNRRKEIMEKDDHMRSEMDSTKDDPYFVCRCHRDPEAEVWQIEVEKKDWRLD